MAAESTYVALVDLAIADPDKARRAAEDLLAGSDDPLARSYAFQSLGVVLRDSGRAAEALEILESGLAAAQETQREDRECDVRATYGATLVHAGRTREGLHQLDRALTDARTEVGAKVLMRKAGTLAALGRHRQALPVMREALAGAVEAGNRAWEARTRIWLAHLELRLGNVDAAERETSQAAALFRQAGDTVERLRAIESLAEIALARGDVSVALKRCAEALDAYRLVGFEPRYEVVELNARLLLSAGLPHDAVVLLEELDTAKLAGYEKAEFELLQAEALFAAGDYLRARDTADAAVTALRREERDWFELRARLLSVRARAALRDPVAEDEARRVADLLHAEGASEAPVALIVAGRSATGDARARMWRAARSYRDRPNGIVRASAHLAGALEHLESGGRGGVLRACTAGLDAIDEHRRLMGSSELRALATTHGRELTEIALRQAAHDPRTLLRWSERTRATTLAQPPATSDAATIPASLAALRDNGRRLAEARQAGEPTAELEKERLRLERAVRTEAHTRSASETDPQRPVRVEDVVTGVGDGCLVELVDVDGALHVLVVHNGRVRRRVAGTTAEVADLLGPAAMLLRRAARGRPANTADIGRRLQEAVLGDAARLVPDGAVLLAPTARLHGLAWALLPLLHDRPFAVVPSAGQWLRATSVARPRRRRTVLVAGPDLQSGGAEVPVLAERHPDALVLGADDATVPAVLDNLDGADLAHLATHGHFRADSPLFSSLDLADGPLTVHDLERLRRAPYRVVLSACESGVLAPVGAGELLGLATALFSIGTAGLVSSVGEVNDEATAELMVGLHDGLAVGLDPATALLAVRRAAADDPVAAGTAAAFVALGA